jgi:hypothetical protein
MAETATRERRAATSGEAGRIGMAISIFSRKMSRNGVSKRQDRELFSRSLVPLSLSSGLLEDFSTIRDWLAQEKLL